MVLNTLWFGLGTGLLEPCRGRFPSYLDELPSAKHPKLGPSTAAASMGTPRRMGSVQLVRAYIQLELHRLWERDGSDPTDSATSACQPGLVESILYLWQDSRQEQSDGERVYPLHYFQRSQLYSVLFSRVSIL